MNLPRWLVLLCFIIQSSFIIASPLNIGLIGKINSFSVVGFYNWHSVNTGVKIFRNAIVRKAKRDKQKNDYKYNFIDTLPQTNNDTVVIPFEYKQSALYHPFTFKAIDSVIDILLKNELVTLSIDGYAHVDEGSDSICYYLSLDRALVIRDYVLGRGIDSSRIISLKGLGNLRSIHIKTNKQVFEFNCRAEIMLYYPLPPIKTEIPDKDGDGITDSEDKCPDEYGDKAHNGCPNKDAIIVPFETQQSSLYSMTYNVLDSVIAILRNDPSITISIEGHAYKDEGIKTLCDRLAKERADIVRRYLLTRRIAGSRIDSVKSFGNLRPLNAGKNPQEIARNSRVEIFLIRH